LYLLRVRVSDDYNGKAAKTVKVIKTSNPR